MALLSSFLLLSVSCTEVTVTGRKQLNLIPSSMLIAMSSQSYRQFISEHKLSSDADGTKMVKNVGQRIRTAVEQYCAKNSMTNALEGYQWEINLVEDPNINAWAMPGGKIVVYTGLLPIAKTETGLAVVMGHEIAHNIANHGNERMSQGLLVDFGGIALPQALENNPAQTRDLFMRSYGIGTQYGFVLPYSRMQETEADRIGLIFMAMAGYDPHEAVNFWQRMSASQQAGYTPELLSTHPSDETRIANIRNFIPEAIQYYKTHGQ